MNIDFETLIFVIVSGAAIAGALGCVFSSRVAHSLLWLMFTFFAVAAAFLMAYAEMLAAVQILVYLGSVMLVVQFGIMLTRRRIIDSESMPTLNLISVIAGIGVFSFILILLREVMDPLNWGGIEQSNVQLSTVDFANSLFNDWTIATVTLGSLLAMAMIGASYLVRDERLVNLVWDIGQDDIPANIESNSVFSPRREKGGEEE